MACCFPFKYWRNQMGYLYDAAPTVQIKIRKDKHGLGIKLNQNKDKFLEITFIETTGAIANSGLQIGDELLEVNNTVVLGWTRKKFRELERKIGLGKKVKILVFRGRHHLPDLPDDWMRPKFKQSLEDLAESDSKIDVAGLDDKTAPSTSDHDKVLSVSISPHSDVVIQPPVTHHEDAAIVTQPPVTHDEDPAVVIQPPVSHDEDAAIVTQPPVTHDEEAAIVTQPPVTHDEEAALVIQPPVTHDEEAALVIQPPMTHHEAVAMVIQPPVTHDEAVAVGANNEENISFMRRFCNTVEETITEMRERCFRAVVCLCAICSDAQN